MTREIVEHLGLSLGISEVRTEAVATDPTVAGILRKLTRRNRNLTDTELLERHDVRMMA